MSTVQAVTGVPPSSRGQLRMLLDADLGFHGTNTNQGAHGWHPFPAKFPPQLPAHFIQGLTESGDTVLDPMLGSGTTLVEAARLGRHAIGCDIDPLARLIAGAKLAPLPTDLAMATGMEILERAKLRHADDNGALAAECDRRFDAKTREFLNYWFSESVQRELLALLMEVEALANDVARRYFQVVFSSTIIAKSGGVSLARDLAHTRPHRVCD
ncbi:MAG: site-specific DNA-methyltransferase, partial [Gammaproteobacteria bacterium]|nr:site-specific DNA-methyltransferase [Gammaproteobacteria bacterium]